jgi:hypothetical protein
MGIDIPYRERYREMGCEPIDKSLYSIVVGMAV